MVSEGVDIRRLRVIVYATNVVAELSFRQIIGRVVRVNAANGESDHGLVVLPSDPRLIDMATQLRLLAGSAGRCALGFWLQSAVTRFMTRTSGGQRSQCGQGNRQRGNSRR
jgi:superfamily II DNA or RNA helicase